jgi:AcrR family transcriptional regulator
MVRQADSPGRLPRHRHQLTRQVVEQTQAARILRATAAAVAEKGYRAATVGDIVRRAGVSTKTFYQLYADKEAALCAVYDAVDAIIERYDATHNRPRSGDARTRLHAAVAFALGQLATDATLARLLIIEAVGGGPRIQARRNKAFRRMAELIARSLRRGRPAGIDKSLIIAYLGGVTELVLQHLADSPAHTLGVLVVPACRFTDAVFFPRLRR